MQISFYKQPVTLVITNAVSSVPSVAITHHVDVAADVAFAAIVQSKGCSAGRWSDDFYAARDAHCIHDVFLASAVDAGGTVGPFSGLAKFVIEPVIVIEAPQTVRLLNGSVEGTRVTLLVQNAAQTGPTGDLSYRSRLRPTKRSPPR